MPTASPLLHVRGKHRGYPIYLGRGNHRAAYLISPRHVTKVHLPVSGLASMRGQLYNRAKERFEYVVHGGFNELELRNFRRIWKSVPKHLRSSFARISSQRGKTKERILRIRVVRDADGSLSKTLRRFGPVSDPVFWRRFDLLVNWMLETKNYFLDFNAENVAVKRLSNGSHIPVLIDYKRVGYQSHPLQWWLRIPIIARARMLRRIGRRIDRYRIERQSMPLQKN
ncbi:MAG: hypothetical protein IPJ89_05540 [Candidatus Iainarchaeum archaeon]|uniref:PhoP regulatory network protein YrbL n=1 Tax=Candidatus Iainarchaeum sp. TaxID=3101447 RepID=A0A7T9DJQ4_9ARCH|nr:MAG: hypothetical protein IPJ89_05540 [Candidatus Diapherotrites archaeon]